MIGRASTPAVSPYLDAFNMVSGGSTKRSSSSTSVRSAKPRSAPGTPKPGTPSTPRRARTPGGSQESGTVFTLEFNGGLRGGRNPVIVFTGSVSNNDKFSFTSKRTPGQNFNAVIYIDGLRYHQLSGCCENRYKEGSSFGNRLTIQKVEGAKPCYRCQFEKELKKQR
ncbi:uncharacterized protein LOC111247124 isoform X2 [Varroa destructor]|uniref:DUF4590 domain-containing protein n=1 Tax=Varroa destructor TaxID=109461 RepID=A0A7M7JMC2_VARDE|nr:uncharacterized protein LOC111247124 isoform X2 [Varroa destructor]